MKRIPVLMKRILVFLLAQAKRFALFLIVLTVAVVAGTTNLFSASVREFVVQSAAGALKVAGTTLANLLLAVLLINIAWSFRNSASLIVQKLLDQTSGADRGKVVVLKLFKAFYWLISIFVILSVCAPVLMSKLALALGLFLGALTIALQGLVLDFVGGLMTQFNRKVKEGDEVATEGLASATGKVLSVGYFSTIMESEKGIIHVPNREVWSRAVMTIKPKPPQSKIILPPGYEAKKTQEKEK